LIDTHSKISHHTEEVLDGSFISQHTHAIPNYLTTTYWWAYVSPKAIRFFDREFLVNLILFGNFKKLRDRALDRLGFVIEGKTLQIASVYGDFTQKIVDRLTPESELDVIDIVPGQLENLQKKLCENPKLRLMQMDSSDLSLERNTYDQVISFFLLHEQPQEVRSKTIQEAWRVVKPGGRLVIVDYHRPRLFNPIRLVLWPVLKMLEPFALDLWRDGLEKWIPEEMLPQRISKRTFFGGVYQKLVYVKS
jgi:ubiquinone/menaquinone biosynthesis C-methylase UbiE